MNLKSPIIIALALLLISHLFLSKLDNNSLEKVSLILGVIGVIASVILVLLFFILSRKFGGELETSVQTLAIAFVFISARLFAYLYADYLNLDRRYALEGIPDVLLLLGVVLLGIGAYSLYKGVDSAVPKIGSIKKLV